ncbi:MAG: PD-(D/E)XK nuclease domain-containing protein [Lachnospiraceae bacterium]|nr:PD-(D/E)XK nuclease domain-containing protein [Lachnospiraceae bacterium]
MRTAFQSPTGQTRPLTYIFNEKIMSWFDSQMKERDLTKLYTAFVKKDTQALEQELSEILYETIRFFDESENYYHGIVAGMLSGMKGYRVKSNRESGKGRCDLFVKPLSRRKEAFVAKVDIIILKKDEFH